ncbi:hypothetical protein ISN44_As08g000790 [Arabidopsis suecica]|uniref:Uncharacterized protein n=1 Tax=Arabidopsis suecica TaxID=45249 RepID=A0A8T2B4Y1_ARASU|nr:hypothetical protein ISN44_As08g000790 [Arabidopsis suecica]
MFVLFNTSICLAEDSQGFYLFAKLCGINPEMSLYERFKNGACSWRGLSECRVKLYMKGKSEDELGRDSFRACEIPKR